MKNKTELRIANHTDPQKLAWAIAKSHEEGAELELRAVGVNCVNSACKAVAIANGLLAPKGSRLAMIPCFGTETDQKGTSENGEVTVMRFALRVVD